MERHLFFEVKGHRLLGALTTPDNAPNPSVGLLLLHGWAGYRAGAHQMFVKLARESARRGVPCLRFDFRGRGDSEGDMSTTTLSTMIEDALEAARILCAETGVTRLALVGDCSGSEVAIGACRDIPACDCMVLWSAPIVAGDRQAAQQAKQRNIIRQYLGKLLRRETWAKLVGGKLQVGMIRRALVGGGKGKGEEGSASDRDIDWFKCFTRFSGRILFIFGAQDPTTEASVAHYRELSGDADREFELELVEGANHAFYSVAWERQVIHATLDWLAGPGQAGEDRGQ